MLFAVLALAATSRGDVRIKDITDVEGVRRNQLTGMGLVVGLNGTGSKSPITRQYAINMLQRMGNRFDPTLRERLATDTTQKTNNLSVVTVTMDLPAFARRGAQVDVLVSTFDDCTSLQGGVLVMTPMFGADGQVYAVASGPISTGGFSFSGQAASVQKNFPTTGRIPLGATIEEETLTPLGLDGTIRLLLKSPDFETARRIATAVNQEMAGMAQVLDAATVNICIPPEYRERVSEYVGLVGSMHVIPDVKARVVINERTGTVIIGENVKVSRVLITHANLVVTTSENQEASQPNAFSNGKTEILDRTQIGVTEEKKALTLVDETTTIGDLAKALNALGVAPRDLSSILQQLKESGALHAELEFK
ncbi:flagellar basal body P-ring protein FlgI [Planctomicrobium sp. SH664]|uniref:flagellar basal body P-ring protein FlgI n=1 Tax=Planctomicrobium sp. SH664 TaxID=3448125 RepID=UPI003F5C7456